MRPLPIVLSTYTPSGCVTVKRHRSTFPPLTMSPIPLPPAELAGLIVETVFFGKFTFYNGPCWSYGARWPYSSQIGMYLVTFSASIYVLIFQKSTSQYRPTKSLILISMSIFLCVLTVTTEFSCYTFRKFTDHVAALDTGHIASIRGIHPP